MKYLNLALFCAVACSSSVAQDVPLHQPTFEEPEPIKIDPVPSEPEPELRKVIRNNKVELKWLTRICVSEGGFNFNECERILQTLENMREDRTLLWIMQAQSSRVTRQKPFTSTRQIWVSHLPMRGEDPPAKGWIECQKGKRCTGTWTTVVRKWLPFREKVHELYYSGVIPNSVPGHPIQWGGDMDYWRGVGRNFCPLNEGGPFLNTYWGDPNDPANKEACLPVDEGKIKRSKTLSAAIASGRAMQKTRIQKLLSGDPLIQDLKKGAIHDRARVD